MGAWWWEGSSEPSSYGLTLAVDFSTGAGSIIYGIDQSTIATPIDASSSRSDNNTAVGATQVCERPTSTVSASLALVALGMRSETDTLTATPTTEDELGIDGDANYGFSHTKHGEVGQLPAANFTASAFGGNWLSAITVLIK